MSKKKRSFDPRVIPRRLNLLFGVVILLFIGLIARLGYMQVVNKDFYLQKMAKASKTKVTTSSVRGQIYDANGTALVENETKQVVSFTRDNKMTAEDIKKIAQKLVNIVTVSDTDVTERQLVDYYLADSTVYKQVVDKLPHKQKYDTDGNKLSESKIYNNAVKSVDVKNLNYSDEEKKVISLFSQMNKVTNFQTGLIKTDNLTSEQIAQVASNTDLTGISTATSWERKVMPTSLSSIVGSVSSQEAGLPAEEVDDYLKKGYSLNDRVGTSYLEKEYESTLQGERAVKEIYLDKHGNMENVKDISAGKKGKNLKLTVDLNFQNGVEDILRNYFNAELASGNATYSEGVYAVAMNPNTGAILAMAGIKHDSKTGELTTDALGTITDNFVPGSIVKGATLTAGWENNAITGNQVMTDQPINFGGSTSITSWFTQYGSRNITAVEALEYSSNTYMVQLALNLLGTPYGGPLNFSESSLEQAMKKLRSGFAQYGMGTSTGIDLSNESEGYVPKDFTFSNYLTNAFGQFDNYTPMQLAQYAATVANGGKRVAPHLVEGIYGNSENGGLGDLIEKKETKELNKVNISDENMDLIKQGFYQVVHGTSGFTTGRTISQGEAVPISAKTGTAETFVAGGQAAINTNVVAYAPSNNPQIAVAVVFPHNTNLSATVSHSITRDIINLYQQQHPMN
ncbi:penicillin-binding protein PBP2B [Streptococcus massiliensis]|uniref:Putative penicillin binding protein 2B n=1 Tax=Streptococcus massiliensis TaxID=313439 RepID=A0A380L2E7_9STRE|nr:penicillin-binding protein PBP2B [Streptococcus massiliensis]SUN77515.1 putative penicillin binding protein 2B [Streptococcus massiliensis]